MKNQIQLKSPAKINLFLDIIGKRPDGYHTVNMVMQAVSLFDTITINKTCDKKITINMPNCTPLLDEEIVPEENTAYRAASEFFRHTGLTNTGVQIDIEKNIPVCAGLAGGSTDASAVLIGLNEMFGANLARSELPEIGKKVGADVPFCIFGGTMLATGIGTDLTALPPIPQCYFVLCKPNLKISTKTAYEASDKDAHPAKNLEPILEAISFGNLKQLSKAVFNSFEEILRLEEVEKIKLALIQQGALSACMSGSGPTVYGIFENEAQALACLQNLKSNYQDVFICTPEKFGSRIF